MMAPNLVHLLPTTTTAEPRRKRPKILTPTGREKIRSSENSLTAKRSVISRANERQKRSDQIDILSSLLPSSPNIIILEDGWRLISHQS